MIGTHKETLSLLLKVADPFEIRDLIPQSRIFPHKDYNVVVKHTLENVRVLRNLGHEAPIPPYHYPGKHRPYDHQKVMVDFYVTHDKGFNLSEMGAMKTAATLWAADILMSQGFIQRAAIFCPLSTMDLVWMQEIFDTLMHRTATIVHGGPTKRAEALAREVDFYIINHDGLCTREVSRALKARKDIGLLVIDEGSKFRNAKTDMYKALEESIKPWHKVWWITGAPTPNAPTDAWAQARIMNINSVPKFFGTFKRDTMRQVSQFKWVPKREADNIVFKALQPAVRFKKEDCIQLPPVTVVPFKAQLTKEQEKAYKDMQAVMAAELAAHQVTAVNAADKINKLRQILCGCVKHPKTDEYIPIPHSPRVDALCDAIDGALSKALVIVPFKGIIQVLAKELRKKYTLGIVNGDVAAKARDKIFKEFKRETDPHILLCHPTVMAHGLNLTEADTLIFYAPIYSNDEYGQVIERINRAGQRHKMTLVRIGAHPLEWQIYKMVDARKQNQENILALYKAAISDLT